MKCGNATTGLVFPCPGQEIGKWVVCCYEKEQHWPLEAGMLVRQPLGMDEFCSGTYEFAPAGRAVVTVRLDPVDRFEFFGTVAMDLSQPPFPKALWYFDGTNFHDTNWVFQWDPEEAELTEKFFGRIDAETWFWLF